MIEDKLQALREEYKTATDLRKSVIEQQAQILNIGLRAREKRWKPRDLTKDIQETLL